MTKAVNMKGTGHLSAADRTKLRAERAANRQLAEDLKAKEEAQAKHAAHSRGKK